MTFFLYFYCTFIYLFIYSVVEMLGNFNKNGNKRGIATKISNRAMGHYIDLFLKLPTTDYEKMRQGDPGLPSISKMKDYFSEFNHEEGWEWNSMILSMLIDNERRITNP